MGKKYEPPKDGLATQVEPLARLGLSAIPVAGPVLNELFAAVLGPAVRKRQGEWMDSVSEAIRSLEAKNSTLVDDLRTNEVFIDTVMQASQAAIKTSNKTKLNAYKNAIVNSCKPSAPEASMQSMFVTYIESLTPTHIQLLQNLRNPPPPSVAAEEHSIADQSYDYYRAYQATFGNPMKHRDLIRVVVEDLYAKGLIHSRRESQDNVFLGLIPGRVDRLGIEFLDFIAES